MTKLTESDIEQMTIELLEGKGYEYLYGPDIAPEGENPMRSSLEEVVLRGKLEDAVRRLKWCCGVNWRTLCGGSTPSCQWRCWRMLSGR